MALMNEHLDLGADWVGWGGSIGFENCEKSKRLSANLSLTCDTNDKIFNVEESACKTQ